MGKNNPLRSMTPKNKNYKLYKAKKQWITACATFMLTFGATAVVNASVQADATTLATTQASGSTATVAALVQPQSAAAETAQNTDETKRNVVANTTDTSRTSEQKTTTAQATENSSSASVANKTNSEEENKIAATTATTTTNGGYDSATWGTLDTSKWTGRNTTFNGTDYYQLTGYTGDQTHIIVPNEADFEQAGKSTNNLQVSISNDLIKSWQNAATIAFSKTDDKKIKLASTNLDNTFQKNTTLTNLDANSLDTSSVTSMQSTFEGATKLSSLTGISDWNVQKVTNMTRIFNQVTKVPDLSPLRNWKTSSLQNLNTAFANNSFTNLQGLENWDVSHVTDMNSAFMGDLVLNDLSALTNWDTSNVINLGMIFNRDYGLTTLNGLENWNTSKITNLNATFANEGSLVDASAIANWNTSNVTNMSVLFAGSPAQYVDFSKWNFGKVTSASNVINNTKSVVYLGNNSTLTADKLNTLGIANGGFTQPIILASGNLYTLLSNNNTHNITINNANSGQSTTISFPVVYDAAGASNMTDAINSYKDMVDQKLEDYVTEHNYVLKRVSTAPVDDVTGHNNHLVNYATATYQVVTIPANQKKNLQIQDKTTYKGKTLTAKDLVTNVADFPSGTTFEFIDNSEPNWNQLGIYNVKVIATYPVSVNGQQYTAVTTPATAKVTVTDQMQFTITYWDDTENKQIVQFDIKNAGNGAYDNQLSFPKGVNTHNYQSVSVSGVPAGADFAGDFWRPFTDQSCNWTIPNYKWDSAAAPSLFNANVVVHLIHKTQDVTNTDPGAQETRTVTADFVKINENGTPETAPFDSATLDVYYIRQATKDLVTGKVTYGNWKLNTSKGTNGLQVASGSWNLPTDSSADITVNAPELDGYEKADSLVNGLLTTNFGTVDSITSKLTTYYVPKSLTQKTINRVINMIGIDKSINGSAMVKPSTTTQSATITRPVKVNADDSGVIFDGFDGSGWTTGKWGRYNNIPVPNNYTKVIKQIVTHPDGTTTETTLDIPNWRPIPAQTVTIATLPTVINITYTATATAFLAGTNESTYTGSPITLDDLNDGNGDNPIYVGVTGPTGGLYYTLQAGDVEFSSDNGQTWTTEMPTNAGTYELRWSEQGKQNIIKEFGNNSIKWVDAQGNSTFTSTATYIINPAPATFTLSNQTSGNYTKIYDAQPTTSIDPSKLTITANFSNDKVVLDTTGLTSDSYEWVDAQGNSISNPENVGTYYIKLKDVALSTLQKDNPNFTLTNGGGLATYTITAAENTVSVDGTQTETYTGQPISVDYNTNGTNSVQVRISAKDGVTASLSNVQLDSGDFQIVDVSGKPITATNAGGVYHIVLTDTGVAKIQQAVGDNYKISQGTSFGTLVINKAQASAEFSGNPSSTYTGTPNSDYLNGFSIKLNEPNNPTYNLVAGDIEFNVDGAWTTNVPVNFGKYEVRLSQTGWEHIKEINSDNVTWSPTASAGTGTYTITAASANTQLSGHNSMVYNGNSVTTADLYTDGSTIKVAISGNNIVNLPSSFTLADGDYTWNTQDGKAPVNAGNYTLTLSSAGLDKIQAAIDEAVGKGNVILSKDNTGSATFQITQAISPNVQLDGNEKSEYNGHAVSFDPTNEETKKNFGFNNVQGLTIPELTADDFEWVDQDGKQITAPTDAGYYYLQLNEKGKSDFANANPNYTFVKDGKSTISGHITYHIYPASLIIGVSGTASQVYNGQNAAITQTQLDNGDIKLVWGNLNDEPIGLGSFTLTPKDLEVVDSAGNPVSHANAQENDKIGNPAYYVRLTSAAFNKIKNLTGASNYDISLGNATGDFLIYARKAQVTLNGNQTTTYGTDLPLDPSAYHIELTNWNSSVPGPTDAEIIQKIGGLKTGDVYINGFTDGQMPVNVGSYQVKIADQLLQRLQVAFPDYDWDAVSRNNGIVRSGSSDSNPIDARHEPATYVITPADTTVTINGAEHIKYGENSTIQYGGDNGYGITITAPVKNATTDNEHEPIYTNLKLETGDLEFVTAPGNVGTYEVRLSDQGLKKLQALTGSTNYNWTQASAARANFFVDQMPVTITVGGNEQNVTYGSNDWLKAIKENPQGYTLTVKTENGTTLNYQAKDGDLIFSQTPGDVGSYQVVLSAQGLENIKTALGTNYAYPQDASDVTTYGIFKVNQGKVTISLDGSDSKTYDGKATTPADLNTGKYNLTYSATVYAPDGTAQTIQLNAEDLQFANGNPVNAGSYTVELSPAGQAKLKSLTGNNGDNYKWTFNTQATYTINAATDASASLSGSNQMIFNGSPVTTAELNNGGNIVVNLTFPGSTENSIYHLQDGDYIWNDGAAPTNVGTYTIKLTQAGLAHLQAAIDQYAGSGNAKISADNLTGSATFEIIPKSITDVTISGSNQEKTYDGQAASLDVNDLTISATDLITDSPLSMKDITASDFDWYDAQGEKLDAIPTDAGAYEARLKPSALQALQKDNPNYSFNTAGGTIKYTINQKAATDTLGGNGNKVYNGQETTVSDVLNSITWTPSGLVDGQSLDLSNLTADDYAWYTKNADSAYTEMTGLPTNAGTYYLKLKDNSIAKIQAANPNYSFATGAIDGEYTYIISQANALITLPATSTQTITWTGNPATIDPANFIPEITTNNPNEKIIALPSTLQLTASDYEFLQDGKVISAPSEVGTYQVRLSQAGWQKVQNAIAGNANYTWNYQGEGNYHIEKASATITLDGSASTIYTGNPVVIPATDGVVNSINVKLSNGQTYVLKPADLEFVDKQGNQIPVPTNAGSYRVRLTEAALDQIQKLENNHYNYTYNNDAVDFIVEKATADVTTSGSYDVVYNGQTPEIKVDKIANTITTNNGVKLTAPTLSAGDYEWVDKDGKVIANPVNVGTYYLKLKDSSQSKIATNNNYTWNFNGLASVTINKANATISFGGSQETTYTGSVVALDPGNFEVKLSNGQTYQLTDKDIQVIGNPINVGTYQVELSQAGIAAIKAADSNYNYSYNGSKGSLTIVPAKVTATISGSQTTQNLELDPSRYTVMVNGQTITGLTTSDFIFSKDGNPAQLTEAGTYDVELSGDAISKIRQENPNYNITFSSTATFTLENSSQTINYVDTDNKVISSTNISGHIKGTKLPFIPQFPAGWVASDPSSVPSEITLENGITTIKIKHGITNVDHTNPVPDGEKTPTGKVIDGAHENDLNQTITRTIVVTNPDGTKQKIPQEAKIYRDATYDDVTGEVTYGEWSTGDWKEFTPAQIKGYTSSESVVPEIEVKNGQQDEIVNITYTANEQSGKISYQDVAGKEIGSTTITGKTGENITVTPEVPTGWKIVPGQEISKTVTATAEGIPTVIVKVEHKKIIVTPDTPMEDIPNGKVPGDPNKTYEKMDNLVKTPTRTIVVTKPDGSKQTITQSVEFIRTATFDEVTGEITYSDWTLNSKSSKWDAYTSETIPGYTANPAQVAEEDVSQETDNTTVNITYTANEQTGKISYQDVDGKEIGSTPLSGKTGETIAITPEIPAGWQLVPSQEVPKTVTATADGIPTVIIKVEHGTTAVNHNAPIPDGEKTPTGKVINGAHENDLNQTITRTIVVTKPDGTKQTIPQVAEIYRDATYDNVTGEVTYGKWSTAKWDAYTPETVPGYTANPAQVAEEDVSQETDNTTVNITYTANEQSGKISYQDVDGKEIGTTSLSGKTGETITITPEIPAGWQLVPSQEIPKTVTATADGIPMVIVKVEHKTVVVAPETPATDIPTGKVPGDPSKNYPTMEQLTVTRTRTINIKYPSGEEQLIPQKVTFIRTAIFDEVTGEIKYTEWLPQGTAQWASYQPTTVTGYVPSQKIVPAMTVNPETPNETVDITYDKIPEPQEGQEIISYQDANGQVIHTQTVTGEEDSDVSFKPEVPTNWQPTGDLPHSVKITGGTTVIVIEPVTVPVQEHKTVTRIIVEHLPSGDKQTVQTIVLTGTGTKNLVTGEVTDVKWDHGKFAAFTPATVPGYTTNMSIVPEMDVTAASGESIVKINYIPNEQTGFIIYRDENGNEITRTALQGKTGEAVAINPVLPAGWELVPGQSIPATVMATPDGIPDVVVLIKHQMITVKPGEKAPTGKVPGNPSTTYEKMESLTKEVTRTITVKLPDGQRQVITQTVKFTRTATFDAVTGKATYSAWQVDGSNEWPAYTAPAINGYTTNQVAIPAELVIPSDENQSIEIEYAKNNQPVEPDKPVTPITPDQPTTPTNPDQPAQPTEPSVPAKPIAPTNNGDKVMPGNQLPTEPVEQEKQQVSNQHFISHQLTQTSSKEKSKANILPQTGNDQNSGSILGFAFAALASILGLTGLKKKREK
ncbi:BspA family leucine-rich repeat surface protein [Limosilactobacillus reuteri]|uniref:MBG domain-containing protein n=1 Tax=Limosilactobacillus reuteri TaxID=1598 RepID=UPI001E4C7C19|nr:MBG domain-containing protein [Limosilactobacillus reuteri]MCC4347452.1 BspA family leucine-rich repeat surface protein [Limosilactobacillus reuteri]MCC4376027.1 BspA family leucine-rich repeat surface protein [Limosilactobacillus reuteri]MCC4384903.1 BspA family leucine-rich repeat surface protein [Limosilactobacillus reuteri]